MTLQSPYPYFGGKRAIAAEVWARLGNVPNYIEPFLGSAAVLLARPDSHEWWNKTETVNDKDGFVCNFWRALQSDPEQVAHYADWPVLENDLHARHYWLLQRKDSLQAKLEGDPDWYDAKIAGWWVWGMSLWIGSGFCSGDGSWYVNENGELVKGNAGQGVQRQLVHLGNPGQGVQRKYVHLTSLALAETQKGRRDGLLEWMQELANRFRRVRVCCGDWTRVCGGKSGAALGYFFAGGPICGIFLDPPYSAEAGRSGDLYAQEDLSIAHKVREWAIRHGNDPRLRIALCGYESEHDMPPDWECLAWRTGGGYGLVGNGRGRDNRYRERIWFSPHCLKTTVWETKGQGKHVPT